jgi:hypothetical protein
MEFHRVLCRIEQLPQFKLAAPDSIGARKIEKVNPSLDTKPQHHCCQKTKQTRLDLSSVDCMTRVHWICSRPCLKGRNRSLLQEAPPAFAPLCEPNLRWVSVWEQRLFFTRPEIGSWKTLRIQSG